MIAQGGTFIRPGVLAWDGVLSQSGPPGAAAAEPSCEVIEQAIVAAISDITRLRDLLGELARTRLWLPLPDGPKPVTDGSALTLPVIMTLEDEFVPAFPSVAERPGGCVGTSAVGGSGMAAGRAGPGGWNRPDPARGRAVRRPGQPAAAGTGHRDQPRQQREREHPRRRRRGFRP